MANCKKPGEKNKNGQGSFEHLKNGKVKYYKTCHCLVDGEDVTARLTITCSSETECIAQMAKKEIAWRENKQSKFSSSREQHTITLADACRRYLEDNRDTKFNKGDSDDRNEGTFKNQILPNDKLANTPIEKLKPVEIRNHIVILLKKYSVSTTSKAFSVISGALQLAVLYGEIESNPCDIVRKEINAIFGKLEDRATARGVIIILDENDEKKLLSAINALNTESPYYMTGQAILILLVTGIRISELCALRRRHWSVISETLDVELRRHREKEVDKDGVDHYPAKEAELKNCHRRTISLEERGNEAFKSILTCRGSMDPDDYWFLDDNGGPTEPGNFIKKINDFYLSIGLEGVKAAHILRRTFVSRRHRIDNWSVDEIAAYIGDTPDTVRKHYLNLTEKIMEGDRVLNVVEYYKRK